MSGNGSLSFTGEARAMPNSEIEPLCGLTVMAHRGKCGANPSLRGRLRSWAVHSFIVTRNPALAKRELGVVEGAWANPDRANWGRRRPDGHGYGGRSGSFRRSTHSLTQKVGVCNFSICGTPKERTERKTIDNPGPASVCLSIAKTRCKLRSPWVYWSFGREHTPSS